MDSPPTGSTLHRCWAEIDLGAIRSNVARCRELAGNERRVMAVIKADAYGHGISSVARALASDVDFFAVANLEEARKIRLSSAETREIPILLLGPAAPHEREGIVAENFSVVVSSQEEADAFATIANDLGKSAHLHVMVDTGMGRIGVLPESLKEFVHHLSQLRSCRLEGIATHFPSADEDRAYTAEQIQRFRTLIEGLHLPDGCQIHLANSAGLIGYPDAMNFATLVRPGLAIYGISPLPISDPALRPALTWKTRVTQIRHLPAGASVSYGRSHILTRSSRLATLGAGYGDGYPRQLSGQGAEVLIAGQRCPLLGRVTMDQIVVDLTDLSEFASVQLGDEAVLLGRQGDGEITVTELAQKAETISWAILTGITSRVVRVSV